MGKLPAFQFYPADWRKDPGVQSLSFHDRGVWFEILCLMHESEQRGRLLLNGKPMPDEALARLLGLDKQILTKTVTTLIEYGVASRSEDGALVNRRMVRDENLRVIRQNAGKLGGNPVLVKQNATKIQNELNQKSTPSSSSSTSISKNNPPRAREGIPSGEIENPELEALAQAVQTVTGIKAGSWQLDRQIRTAAMELQQQGFSAVEVIETARQSGKAYKLKFIASDLATERAQLGVKRNGNNAKLSPGAAALINILAE